MNKTPKQNFLNLNSVLRLWSTSLLIISGELYAADHFAFDSISSPQFTNIPFAITITALTSQGTRDTNFTGSTALSATGQTGTVLLQPTSVGPFVSGAWTGTVQVLNTDRFVQLQTGAAPGVSNPFHVEGAPYRVVNLSAMDLVYDASRHRIYASVPNDAGVYSNSIVTIDPESGTILSAISVPDIVRPVVTVRFRSGKLAISDNAEYLYVSVSNALAVQRYDLTSQTLGPIFAVGNGQFGGPFSVADMLVLPGAPGTVVVARADGFNAKGVAIYDGGVPRSQTTPELSVQDVNVIEPSGSPNLLYGYNNQNTGFDFIRLAVDASGVAVQDTASGLLNGFSTDMFSNGGRVFGSTGRLVDPAQPALLGTFNVEGTLSLAGTLGNSVVTADSAIGRAFYVTILGTNFHAQAHDISALLPLKALDIPQDGGGAVAVVRWGSNGLAFATSAGKVYLVQSSLLIPMGNPADLVVTQSTSGVPTAGNNFTISATVTNKGPEYASGVVLTDLLPTNCIFVSATVSQGAWSTNVNGFSANLGMLAPGSTATVAATIRPFYGGWTSNCVFAVGNESDPFLANNASTQELYIRIDAQPNSVNQIRLPVADLAYDRASQKLYASVSSRAGIHGNNLIAFDTANWQPTNSIYVGNEPARMAESDDGSNLYVTVNSNQSICRVDLAGPTATSTFNLTSNAPTLFVEDLAVLPGQSHSVAVSRSYASTHEAVAVYDDGVQRGTADTAPGESYPDDIEFGTDASILFTHNGGAVGYSRLQINDQGVSFLDSDPNLLGSFNSIQLKYVEGLLYSTGGLAIDPVANLLKGKIVSVTNSTTVCFDAATRRLFFLQAGETNYVLLAVEPGSLLILGSMNIPGVIGVPTALTRWGADGFAFRTTGEQLFVLRTSLLPTTAPADLRLTALAAPGGAVVTSNYLFSIQITNSGPSDANHVLVSNTLPPGSSVISVSSSQGTSSNANGIVVCDLGAMTNGAIANLSVRIQMSQAGIFSIKSQVASDALDLMNANNQYSWAVWCGNSGTTAQLSANLAVNDIVADRAGGRVYASIGSVAGALANTIVWLDPIAGLAGPPVSAGANPNRLAISKDGSSIYAGLDDASAIQRLDTIAQTTADPFSLGSGQTALFVAVDPNNSSQVVAFRQYDYKIAAYVNGIKSSNELSGVSLLAFGGSNGVPFVCDGGHSPVPLYQALLDSSGLSLGPSQPAQQPATELKSDGGLLFYNRGMIVDPDLRRVKAMIPVPFNALVEPDVASGRVFYLTPFGGGWTLRAFDLTQGIEIGSSPVSGISGNPKRLVRCGIDAFAICTDAGQLVVFRSSLVPTGSATDVALTQVSSAAIAGTNSNLTLVLSLTNKGPATAQSIVVTQSFSLSVTSIVPIASVGSVNVISNVVSWQPGTLTNGGFASLSVSLRPTQLGTMMVNAAARHSGNDPFWANNAALSTISVTNAAGTNTVQLRLATRELLYDPFRNVIYASLPATNQLLGNVVGIISPETGNLTGSLFAGSEPDQLALSQDGRYLYVSLDGTMGIRRFDLTAQSDSEFPFSLSKLYNASDLKVQPGNSLTFAVSRIPAQGAGNPESVAIYDNATPRINAAGVTKPLVFSADGSQIYGTLPLGSGIGFLRLQIGPSGVSQLSSTPAYGGDTDFDIAGGLVYGTTGRVLDPTVPTAVGTNKATGSVVVDGSVGRAFYLTQVGVNYEIRACQIGTYQSLGTNAIGGVLGSATNLIRCGGDRLAFRTTSNQLFIVRSTLVPASDLAITGTSTPLSLLSGQVVSNFVAVTNLGPVAATNVFITNFLSGAANIVSVTPSQGSVGIGAGLVTWSIGNLTNNGFCSISLIEMATNSSDGVLSNFFTVTGSLPDPVSANNSLVFTNFLNADNDHDGMADTWEMANGFDPSDPSDAVLDVDGDGQSNRNEYLAGTNPHDPTSALRISGFQSSGSSWSLTFSSVLGKSYIVERTTGLGAATWIPTGAPVAGTGGSTIVAIPPAGGLTTAFYRVRLLQQ